MTCIAGLISGGKVYMAADSLVSDESGTKVTSPFDKIVRKSSRNASATMLIGFAGSVRGAQILQYHVELDDHPGLMPPLAYLVTKFVPALRAALKEHGALFKKNGEQMAFNDLLIAYKDSLFEMDGDFQIREVSDYAAIGSGSTWANGCLFGNKQKKPSKRVKEAVEAAAEFNANVGGDIVVKVL